jgi:hypothetical protein
MFILEGSCLSSVTYDTKLLFCVTLGTFHTNALLLSHILVECEYRRVLVAASTVGVPLLRVSASTVSQVLSPSSLLTNSPI